MPRIHWTWVFVALLVAVSLSLVSFPVNGAVVTTEPEVRLRQGLPGSVPCMVTRKLSAVYWKKGETIESATTVVKLHISDNNGDISGPGFDDGEFTVASNYSLIFTNARSTDSGRYFCEVSDYETGVLYRNYSDVTISDPPVITDPRRVLQYGERAILRCQYEKAVYAVSWRKGDEYANAKPVVALDMRHEVNQREFGDGYDQGWYNISDDYSLVINSARIRDRGRYYCVVSDLATGRPLVNSTYVDIGDPPVVTDARRVLQYGDRSTLRCQYEKAVYAVYWLKGDTYADADLLVVLDLFQEISDRKGPGYDQGWYNISEDFSLVINSTRMQDKGKYFCAVLDLATGNLLSNSTSVEVVGSGLLVPFGITRTTQGAFTPTTAAGSQTDANNIVTAPVSVKGASAAVPVILAVLILIIMVIAGILLYRKYKKKKYRPDDSACQTLLQKNGHLVSFVELWHLVSGIELEHVKRINSLANAVKDLNHLPINAVAFWNTCASAGSMYYMLCKWKDRYKGKNQLQDLIECLREHRLDGEVTRLEAFREDAEKRMPIDTIEELIRKIDNKEKIKKIFKDLDIFSEQSDDPLKWTLKRIKASSVVGISLRLDSWQQRITGVNPLVLLNLAMENAKCTPTDRIFFKDFGRWIIAHSSGGTNDVEQTSGL